MNSYRVLDDARHLLRDLAPDGNTASSEGGVSSQISCRSTIAYLKLHEERTLQSRPKSVKERPRVT
jgi:hypothetical protein